MVFHNNLLWWSTVRDLFLGGAQCRRLVDSFLSPRNPKSSLIIISIYESTVKKTITWVKTGRDFKSETKPKKLEKMELSLFNNKTTVNAHSQLLAVQQQQIHQAATAIDIYRHNKGNIGG